MNEIDRILSTISALRDKETGCPWDKVQTLQTLVKPLKEETEELIDALKETDNKHIAEELGDIMWNALMLLAAAEEEGIATKAEILNAVNDKMLFRHPHVFGAAKATTLAEAKRVYATAKSAQQGMKDNAL